MTRIPAAAHSDALLALAFLAIALLGACAGAPPAKPDPAPRPLLTPASLGAERAVSQVVRAAFGAREATFSCVVTVKDGAMTVVGLNTVGIRLFTLRYDGKAVHSEKAAAVPNELEPQRLLVDLQLVFWPLAELQGRWHPAGWQINEPAAGMRRLRRDDSLVAEVHYAGGDPWTGRAWLVNFEHGYSLQIDSQVQ